MAERDAKIEAKIGQLMTLVAILIAICGVLLLRTFQDEPVPEPAAFEPIGVPIVAEISELVDTDDGEPDRGLSDSSAVCAIYAEVATHRLRLHDVDGALAAIDTAINRQPENVEYHTQKGTALIAGLRLNDAAEVFDEILQMAPDHLLALAVQKQLIAVSVHYNEVDGLPPDVIFELHKLMRRYDRLPEAVILGRKLDLKKQDVQHLWRWVWARSGIEGQLATSLDENGRFRVSLSRETTDLEALRQLSGMPIGRLDLPSEAGISDLSPLSGLDISEINLGYALVEDLTALRGLPLKHVDLRHCRELKSVDGLQNMGLSDLQFYYNRKLESLEGMQGNLVEELDLGDMRSLVDISALKNTPLRKLRLRGPGDQSGRLTALAGLGSLDGLQGTVLSELSVENMPAINSLEPLRGLPLRTLKVTYCPALSDIEPLMDAPLEDVDFTGCVNLRSLAPLKDAPLKSVVLRDCSSLSSLDGLQNKGLTRLELRDCGGLETLDGLQGNALTELRLDKAFRIRDIKALRGTPLRSLQIGAHSQPTAQLFTLDGLQETQLERLVVSSGEALFSIEALEGLPLRHAEFRNCKVLESLDGLQKTRTETLVLYAAPELTDIDALRGLPLKRVRIEGCSKLNSIAGLLDSPVVDLTVRSAKVHDMETVLRELPLESLNIDSNNLEDYEVVRPLRSLRKLAIGYNYGADLSPLAALRLEELHLNNTPITAASLRAIAHLPLKRLYLHDCEKLKDISILASIPSLEAVSIPRHIEDISVLSELPNLVGVSDRSSDVKPLAEFKRRRARAVSRQ
jgi:hypothetical protein